MRTASQYSIEMRTSALRSSCLSTCTPMSPAMAMVSSSASRTSSVSQRAQAFSSRNSAISVSRASMQARR